MTDRTTAETFVAAFAEQERRAAAGEPAWLRDARRAAIARFADRGLPTTRDEDWKYTSLAPVRETAFEAADGAADPAGERLAPLLIGGDAGPRLVFVNGRYAPALSSVRGLPPGARLGSLADAARRDAEALRPHLAPEAWGDADAFTALNAASWRDGAYLALPPGARVRPPLQLVFLAISPEAARVAHPRTLLLLGRDCEATVVETYAGLAPDVYLTNAVTEVVLGDGARLDHARLQLESPRALHVGRTAVRHGRDSRVESFAIDFGGRLARHDVHAVLGAEGAACTLGGLFVIGGVQHVDTRTVVDHAAPRATSRQLFKGVLDGRAHGIFNGRVVVRPGANGTDAQQTNKNLLLADGVQVASKPQLEIFADDVKVSHGAADGQVAGDALFYLNSRGLDEAAARTLLTYGFAHEVLDRIAAPAVREWLERRLMARLGGGHVADEEAPADGAGGLAAVGAPGEPERSSAPARGEERP
jgi:Fe-S cluster assembly protein SufD